MLLETRRCLLEIDVLSRQRCLLEIKKGYKLETNWHRKEIVCNLPQTAVLFISLGRKRQRKKQTSNKIYSPFPLAV